MSDTSSTSTNPNDIFSATNQSEWDQKKQDIMLNLGLENSNETDQTPTPTRFIRNCEEVGLFQDLQNVNPFDEVFKKAVQNPTAVTPQTPIITSDDTLHTPQIYPHLDDGESNPNNDFPMRDEGDNPLVIVLDPEKDKITVAKEMVKAAIIKKSNAGAIIPVPIKNLIDLNKNIKNIDAKEWQKEANRVSQTRCRKRKQKEYEDMKVENKLLKQQNIELCNLNSNLQQTIKKLQEKLKESKSSPSEPSAIIENTSDMSARISAVCLTQKKKNSKNIPIVPKGVVKSKVKQIPIITSPLASNTVFLQLPKENSDNTAITVPLSAFQSNSKTVIMMLPQSPPQSNLFTLQKKQTNQTQTGK
ncbi:unnamed protein product [Ceutorhynchus assimilis]|uniref:BZIP domain-containing protein n=1 Tax=Ceutorhynchus assimilis TaxID=467358 RepID=A0A9P0GJT5_9CUCU|nr:unnamed protein product [Ceutorhynchus assimilis]